MTSGNPSVLPGMKLLEEEGDDQPLVGKELARYRSVAATANFIAQDRPDVKFAVMAEDEEVGEILQRAAECRTEDQV